jgi:dephospho-CoA kinase
MILAGLTGGIASGKSVVSRQFKKLGAHLIDADELAHEAIAPDRPPWRAIVETFGPGIQNPDRTVNRKKLADIVFRDKEKRKKLNSIVHPAVFSEQERLTREISERDPKAVIIYDAALLIETGAWRRMSKVIVVTADPEVQIDRIIGRDGLSREEAERRIASQAPNSEKVRHADYIIDGSRTMEQIQEEVSRIYRELRALA